MTEGKQIPRYEMSPWFRQLLISRGCTEQGVEDCRQAIEDGVLEKPEKDDDKKKEDVK